MFLNRNLCKCFKTVRFNVTNSHQRVQAVIWEDLRSVGWRRYFWLLVLLMEMMGVGIAASSREMVRLSYTFYIGWAVEADVLGI